MSNDIKIVEETTVASIIYTIKNTGECVVDINLDNFEPETVELFAHLFYNITSGKFSQVALELAKDGFSESDRPNAYATFIKRIQDIAQLELSSHVDKYESKQTNSNKERKNDEEPCISPIDILKRG
jgi:hypothetical protein